jgi:hypothetical protein
MLIIPILKKEKKHADNSTGPHSIAALSTKDKNGRKRTYDIEKRKRSVRDISTFSN